MFYFQIFIILLLFAFHDIDKRFNTKSRNIVLLFLFLVFWLVAGLRYETGVDWPGYTLFYNQLPNITGVFNGKLNIISNSEFEPGFTLFSSALKVFTDNVQVLFLIVALFTNLMLFFSLKNYSKHIFVSLLIYFCTMYFVLDMDVIRQSIALNIFFYALNYIVERNIYKYFLAIFIAALFHQTALLLLPFYFFLNKEFKISTLIIFICIVFSIYVFQIAWLKYIVGYALDIIFSGAISAKLYSYGFDNLRTFGIGFLGNLIILIICFIQRKKFSTYKMYNLFLNMYIVNLAIYYSTWEMGTLSSRFRLYFLVGNIVLLTYFIDIYKDKLRKYIVFFFIISYSLFYGRIYLFEYPEAISYNPYQNYLISKLFNVKSTGPERRVLFMNKQNERDDINN